MTDPLRFSVVDEGGVPVAESDYHVPLKLVWVAPELRPTPAYVRVGGPAGAELEFRVDPDSGAVLALVVLLFGGAEGEAAAADADDGAQAGCTLVVEPHVWQSEQSGVVFTELPVRTHRLPDGVQIEVEGLMPARTVHCGPVTFGLDADGSLAFLNVQAQIADRHFQS